MATRQGHDILVYVNTGTSQSPTWTPVAYSTSHKYSSQAETKERSHKDLANPLEPEKYITKISVTISIDALIDSDQAIEGYDALLAAHKAAQPVQIKYSAKNLTAGGKYEQGEFIITSIERNDPTGEDSTFSATFESYGAVTTETVPTTQGS